jgi:hypothetical protein
MGAFASKRALYVTMDGVSSDKPIDDTLEWIAIRATLSLGQRTEMQASVVAIDKGKAEASLKGYLATFNEFAFVDWRLFDDAGQPVPFSKQATADLDPAYPLVDKAMAEFATRNPTYARARVQSG